jgi:RNA-directed DNA polymerase
MEVGREPKPSLVPKEGKQGGETQGRWSWVEPAVWTPRMLTALEEGVKGNQWFSLIDKIYSDRNLETAWAKVASNAGGCGVDGITVERFAKDSTKGLLVLKEQLRQASYQPTPVRRVWIPKPGTTQKRPLGIPTVRDRIVQTALRNVIEPIYEHGFAEHSYGFRPGRGCKDALRRVQELLDAGNTWVVDADLKAYFDTIPHEPLMARMEEKVADGRVLELIRSYLKQGVMEELKEYEAGEAGTPQGAVISPLLANVYLNPLDHLMAGKGMEMVRYADDFVILCQTEQEAREALAQVQTWTEVNGLTLHPEKTHIVNAAEKGGFDFLGYHFERGYRWPRKKSMARIKEKVRCLTKRNSGDSMEYTITRINEVLRGWFGYYKHSHRGAFRTVDCYARGRLRSILRRRSKRKGICCSLDHQRWPNAYFAGMNLFDLTQARLLAVQSPSRSKSLTGEPDAGDPPVRFGGRGGS